MDYKKIVNPKNGDYFLIFDQDGTPFYEVLHASSIEMNVAPATPPQNSLERRLDDLTAKLQNYDDKIKSYEERIVLYKKKLRELYDRNKQLSDAQSERSWKQSNVFSSVLFATIVLTLAVISFS